jgi:hypothetical protein
MKDLNLTLDNLNTAYYKFIEAAKIVNQDFVVYKEGWTKKDIVAHVAFWHEYYAKVVSALAEKQKSVLLAGDYTDINKHGVQTFRKYSLKQIINKLNTSHKIITSNIINHTGLKAGCFVGMELRSIERCSHLHPIGCSFTQSNKNRNRYTI